MMKRLSVALLAVATGAVAHDAAGQRRFDSGRLGVISLGDSKFGLKGSKNAKQQQRSYRDVRNYCLPSAKNPRSYFDRQIKAGKNEGEKMSALSVKAVIRRSE
jgi:hypothetical protein